MAYNIASDIYKTIFSTLQASSDLSYVTTFQSRFYPVRREMETSELYPYLFLSFGEMGQETLHSMPNLHHYNAIISVVAMTWNKGDVNVQTDASNLTQDAGYTDTTTKGILEIIEDVKKVIFTAHKSDRFEYATETKRDTMTADVDWTFSTVSSPDITSLQPLLLSPYIEAKQLNIALSIVEGRLTS